MLITRYFRHQPRQRIIECYLSWTPCNLSSWIKKFACKAPVCGKALRTEPTGRVIQLSCTLVLVWSRRQAKVAHWTLRETILLKQKPSTHEITKSQLTISLLNATSCA
jgi:hypothetical protein